MTCLVLGWSLLADTLSPKQVMAADYQHSIQLDQMKFEWTVEEHLIHIRLQAKTKGWVGIGFNSKDGMKGAGLVIGYVKGDKVIVQDAYGIRDLEHISDTRNNGQDNIAGVSGSEFGTTTTISFTIPLSSADKNDFTIDPSLPTKILLAFGPDRDTFSPKHKFRTGLTVNLQTGQYK
jgi:hypothetical protein